MRRYSAYARTDNSEYKMAAIFYRRYRARRNLRRNRIFRDRSNPFDKFDDVELFRKFRFRRMDIIAITDSIQDELAHPNRRGALTPLLQVLVALRFYASGTFQDVCGELIGVDQATVSRTITRVTDAFVLHFDGDGSIERRK